jgi:hypothetical protein
MLLVAMGACLLNSSLQIDLGIYVYIHIHLHFVVQCIFGFLKRGSSQGSETLKQVSTQLIGKAGLSGKGFFSK